MLSRARLAVGVLLLTLVLACDEDPGVGGFYSLSSVDGRPLPAFAGATVNCDEMLSGGMLLISSDGYDLSLIILDDCTRVGGDTSSQLIITSGGVTISGTTVTFSDSSSGTLTGHQVGTSIELIYTSNTLPTPHTLHFAPTTMAHRWLPFGPP